MSVVDSSLMVFTGSAASSIGALLITNRHRVSQINGDGIRRLSPIYGKTLTDKAAKASTPRQMLFLGIGLISFGLVSVIVYFLRIAAPVSASTTIMAAILGGVQIIISGILFTAMVVGRKRAEGSRVVAPYRERVSESIIIIGVCGLSAILALLLAQGVRG